jgi:hypothetical protein
MNDILDPPAERDLPPARFVQMKTELMAAVRQRPAAERGPATRRFSAQPRWAMAAAAAVVVAAVPVSLAVRHQFGGGDVLAMSTAEITPSLREALTECVKASAHSNELDPSPPPPVTMADLGVAAQRDGKTVAVFLRPDGYVTCETEGSGAWGVGYDEWGSREWLPGPVHVLSSSTTELDGGELSMAGRVSERVHRLVLDHGDGRTTRARIKDGLFGVVTGDGKVRENAELVSYDRTGKEIGRMSVYHEVDRCYTDPAGTILYGESGGDCLPAERWARD